MKQKTIKTSRKDLPSQAMVEFALVLPLLLLIVIGLIEVGRALFIFSSVQTASREATRYGSATGDSGSGIPYYQDCDGISGAAQRVEFIADFDTIDISYDNGPDTSAFDTCNGSVDTGINVANNDRIVVTVTENYEPILLGFIPLASFPMTSSSARTLLVSVSIDMDEPPSNFTPTGLVLAKSASPNRFENIGDEITYTYVVTNYSENNLPSISITDDKINGGAPFSCVGGLSPGASGSCTNSYTITMDDLLAGEVMNTARARASDNTTSNYTDETVTIIPDVSISIEKSASKEIVSILGDTITYYYLVINTGNVSMDTIDVIDSNTSLSISCPNVVLLPGASTTCQSSYYTVTQADLDAGQIVNTATASAVYDGSAYISVPDTLKIIATPFSMYVSTSSNPTFYGSLGEDITFIYTVRNSGTLTVENLQVEEVDGLLTGITCDDTTLLANELTECRGTYRTLQSDLDQGFIESYALASANIQGQALVVESNHASKTVPAQANPGITLAKNANRISATNLGDLINYTFTLVNSGNVALNSLNVNDYNGLPVVCPSTELDPGASVNCLASYEVTLADLENGSILNTARASGIAGLDLIESNEDNAIVFTSTGPRLTLNVTTSATDAHAGETIYFTYTFTNTGNVDLTGPYTINDVNNIGIYNIDCTTATDPLVPGETTSCTADYDVTINDAINASVTNLASVTANHATGTITSNQDEVTVSVYGAGCDPRHGELRTEAPFGMTIFNFGSSTLNVSRITINWNRSPSTQRLNQVLLGGTSLWSGSRAFPPYSIDVSTSIATGVTPFLQINFLRTYVPNGSEYILVEFSNCGTVLDSRNDGQLP
ncbi:MAG: pilus assembly protein [Anaerolineales bacterium]|nr:pilus assembly protein [Anaerolineales bacterium]